MKLLKGTAIIDDPWQHLSDEDALPSTGQVTISFARWQRSPQTISAAGIQFGLRVPGDAKFEAVSAALPVVPLVIVEFPKFRDGRGFSLGRLLRERHGFTGELRASGPLLPDQFGFLRRCGFDAIAVPDETRLADWERHVNAVRVVYQPAADAATSIIDLRHGAAARRPAVAASAL